MSNYTKGKWKVYEDHMTARTDVVSEDGIGFFQKIIANIKTCDTMDETDANARLIASAPDMYEALRALVEWAKYFAPNDTATRAGIEAIRKAEGKC